MAPSKTELLRLKHAAEEALAQGDRATLLRLQAELEHLIGAFEKEVQRLRQEALNARKEREHAESEAEEARRQVAEREVVRSPSLDGDAAGLAALLRAVDAHTFGELLAREADLIGRGADPDRWMTIFQEMGQLYSQLSTLGSRLPDVLSLPLSDEAYLSELGQVLELDERMRSQILARFSEANHEPES